jgi:hypothetical protein
MHKLVLHSACASHKLQLSQILSSTSGTLASPICNPIANIKSLVVETQSDLQWTMVRCLNRYKLESMSASH